MISVVCERCGKQFERKASRIKRVKHLFCSPECHYENSRIVFACRCCGEMAERRRSSVINPDMLFCSRGCYFKYRKSNPYQVSESTRLKSREAHLKNQQADETSREYLFYLGRREHRVVAERKLGRPLKPGEVVHHIDGDIKNNAAENLMVFATQAEHVRWHKEHKELKL